MKALRASHANYVYYNRVFKKIAGKYPQEILKKRLELSTKPFDWTNNLTTLRKRLYKEGYGKLVDKADRVYLQEHRGAKSDEEFEKFWKYYLSIHDVAAYPKDAI